MKQSKDSISQQAIEWSILHLQKHGDTDIFPKPFEYTAVGDQAIREHVAKVDLACYKTRDARMILVPKAGYGFRVSHQLDPIDSIVYTASVYEISKDIERWRVPVDERIACSYRIQPTDDGDFFPRDNGWSSYYEQSSMLANIHRYVLHIDVAAFYNQIYHHRLQGALDEAGISLERSKNIERFLGSLTARQSQGIPIGPAASHVLAEACLNDVDRSLKDKGYNFTRYVDNIRMFFSDRRTSWNALHHVTQYLYTAHRLSIQDSKTQFEAATEFKSERLEDPQFREDQQKERALDDLISEMREASGYEDIGIHDLGEDADKELRRVLEELFREAIDHTPVKFGMIRHVLRRAKSMRSRVLHPGVLEKLESLIPVFRDVCLYLMHTLPTDQCRAREVGDRLLEIACRSDWSCAFVQLWVLHVLQEKPRAARYEDAVKLARSAESELGIRPMALLARAFKKTHWVRGKKETVMALSPWDRRAVIYAGQILPAKEKKIWLNMIKEKGDHLDIAVANCLLSSS